VAEENPRVLVVGEILVGKELGEFPGLFEVVFVSMVFYPEVKAIAAIAEQDQPTFRIRTAGLRDSVGQVKAVAPVDEDDGRRHARKTRLRPECESAE
jgi:hypothetical protein